MSRIVFFGTPAHGHINPTLPLVTELKKMGEEIVYFSTDEFKERIIASGAIYKEYIQLRGFDTVSSGKNLANLYYILVSATNQMIDDLLNEIRIIKPDYIIHDSICVWGRYVAHICKIQAISSVSTFAFNGKVANTRNTIGFIKKVGVRGVLTMIRAMSIQKELKKKYSIKPRCFIDTMMNEEQLNIVYTSREFQPHSEQYDAKKYIFIGPTTTERTNDTDKTDYSKMKHPLIYISMGTIWKDEYDIDTIVDALKGIDGTLVFSGLVNDGSKHINDNSVIIKDHINQIEILKHCDLFITHGGMNSVNESLFYKVPLCIYPFQSEQEEVANRVVELKCGVRLFRLDQTSIREAVELVINNQEYRTNAEKISNSFKNAGGCKEAVKRISAYTKGESS
jgi:MGT family glycosyltransferase